MRKVFKLRVALFILLFVVAILFPLLPYLLNGTPFIGDSWLHFRIVRDTVATGRYTIVEYNERWPLVNLLLTLIVFLTGVSEVAAGAIVPLLTGLASIPLYCLCKRLGLPPFAALTATLFLAFNPLYPTITFSGAVMKETSTYYLIVSILLISSITLEGKSSKKYVIIAILFSFGAVMGHHYASLFILFYLLSLFGYAIFDTLRGLAPQFRDIQFRYIPMITLIFTLLAGVLNTVNYLALGPYFPVFNVSDLFLLLAIFLIIFTLHALDRTLLTRWSWLCTLTVTLSFLGLRGSIFLLVQPQATISSLELSFVVFSATIVGLGTRPNTRIVKALSSSTISLVIFSFLWGLSSPGYILLIKSMHYFSILLALGAGFLSMTLFKKGILGKVAVIGVCIFIASISWLGTSLALNGLGAYRRGELLAASNLPGIDPQTRIIGDTRASYLMLYAANITLSHILGSEGKSNGLYIIFRPNMEQGFLFGYDWTPTELVMKSLHLNSSNRILDSNYITLLLR